MAETNKATLTVVFDDGADSSALAKAEPDDALNKDAEGEVKTSFLYSDRPYFRVHLDAGLEVSRVEVSSGMVRYLGGTTREATLDTVDVDVDGDSIDLEYNPSGNVTFSWFGNSPRHELHGRKVIFLDSSPATGEGRYQYNCHSYQYIPPGLSPGQKWRSRIVVHVRKA